MKTLQDMIKDLTGITVEQNKISKYLESEKLDLRCVNLRWADLQGADLRWADLKEADLRWTDLQGADLRGADLKDADLRGADLKNIKITQQQLDKLTVIEEEWIMLEKLKDWIEIYNNNLKIEVKKLFLKEK
ncbi:pentapeptide repeat-containing protein [Spiroplasma citri]|uniref:Pentapeptide repeat-containing protein n=1 Tax=Spiroplasma citri TaxID=2133 RepID=A0AAX3SX59_SPICI|nr:pentapeptide repeat-containing protein [Spiroplasma citri]WFG95712.1 pentapeptide repeat-containing protein [Spiroplasma citri]